MRSLLTLCFTLLAAPAAPAQNAGAWTVSDAEGARIASWRSSAEGPELASFACDSAAREILVFRAAEPPLAPGVLVILAATGELRMEAGPDPQGTPGMVARIAATQESINMLSTAATLTISIGETGAGLAVPVEQPLRDVLEGCAGG